MDNLQALLLDWADGTPVRDLDLYPGSAAVTSDASFDPVFFRVPAIAGFKVWLAGQWVEKPVKVWNGSAWVVKPVKRWNSTAWV